MTTYYVQSLCALGVSDDAAYRVSKKLTLSSLDACDPIGYENSSDAVWRLIINGVVAAIIPSEKRGSKAQNIYGSGAWFGEQPIINADFSYIRYVCITDVELLNMPAPIFLQLLEEEPNFARYIARLTSWRAQRDVEMLMLMRVGNPCLRTAVGLGLCFEALASKFSRQTTQSMSGSVSIPAKQEVLAQLCGVSRTSFWESLRRLDDAGWLKVSYGGVELLNLPTWRAFMRQRRQCRFADMAPTIDQVLSEFSCADMAREPPAQMQA